MGTRVKMEIRLQMGVQGVQIVQMRGIGAAAIDECSWP